MQCYYYTYNFIVTLILILLYIAKKLKKLERKIEISIKWFEENKSIVNPNKFEAIKVNRSTEFDAYFTLNINN